MRNYPTIAVVEFTSIATGVYCTDLLLKKAPVAMVKSGTVSGGRHLIIIGGSTASVEESLVEALAVGQAEVFDHVLLPHAHNKVHDAIMGRRAQLEQDAVALLETDSIAANVHACELAVKGTEVRLVELRLAEYEMSGKAISLFNGELHAIEAAMGLACDFLRKGKHYVQHRIIGRPHETVTQQLSTGTRFADAELIELRGERVS